MAAKHYLQTTDEHFAKAAANAAHNTTQLVGMDEKASERDCGKAGENENCRCPRVFEMGDTGLETISNSTGKTQVSPKRGTINGTLGVLDRKLATVIRAWPHLDRHRQAIIAGMARKGMKAARQQLV